MLDWKKRNSAKHIMQGFKKYHITNGVIAIAMTLFFSCKNNFKDVKNIGVSANEPQGVGININAKRTDSGRVVANLKTPRMLDFDNRAFGYSECPDGVVLDIFDSKDEITRIVADYAILYGETSLMDLQGNVVVSSSAKDTLYADQLFFDEKKQWLFTNSPVTYKSKDYITKGSGFDSDKDFKNTEVLEISGIFLVGN